MKRCDHLPLLDACPGKIAGALEVMRAFRRAAPDVAADQWERFSRTGRIRKNLTADEEAVSSRLVRAKMILGAARLQMLRWQVVGSLESLLANRANEFRDAVIRSSLPEAVRHPLLVINRLQAWFSPDPVFFGRTKTASGTEIAPEIRRLARTIMRAVLARQWRPSWGGLHPHIDQRQAELVRLAPGEAGAAHAGLWLDLRSLRPRLDRRGRPTKQQACLRLPLRSYAYHEARAAAGGTTALTVQLIERPAARAESATHRLADGRPGELVIGVVSDMSDAFALSRLAYRPRGAEVALDFGLATMFATGTDDLLGRDWRRDLERHDYRIAGLAARLQAQGIRPNRSRRYRERVESFRGFLRENIGRVLNRLVQTHAPAHLTIERLDFQTPGLSRRRRLNRLLARSGRAVIRAKLQDLEQRYGITWDEVNPAYSSQTCSSCGYVAKTNRKTQARFVCECCGHTVHADVNAARNLEGGRSAFDRTARLTKADSLQATVHRHLERLKARDRVISGASVHVSNPYFRAAVASLGLCRAEGTSGGLRKPRRHSARMRKPAPPAPDLVADVSAGYSPGPINHRRPSDLPDS